MVRAPKAPLAKVDGVCTPAGFVELRHPALPDGEEGVLIRVPAYSESDKIKGYVSYMFMWFAGVIITGNMVDSFLSRGKSPNKAEDVVEEGTCLTPGAYYFHVGSKENEEPVYYGILPGVHDYKLVDGVIPQDFRDTVPWRPQNMDQMHGDCIVTGRNDEVEDAHLVHARLHGWFLQQGFLRYASNSRASAGFETRNSSNIIRLDKSLHGQLDKNCWTLFAERDPDDLLKPARLRVTWLVRNDVMANEFHGLEVRGGGSQVSVQAVVGRFAISIFKRLQLDHFGLGVRRKVLLGDGTTKMMDYDDFQARIQADGATNTDPKARNKSRSKSKSKSRSPSKRSRTTFEEENAWLSSESDCESSSSSSSLSSLGSEIRSFHKEEKRGRTGYSETAVVIESVGVRQSDEYDQRCSKRIRIQ